MPGNEVSLLEKKIRNGESDHLKILHEILCLPVQDVGSIRWLLMLLSEMVKYKKEFSSLIDHYNYLADNFPILQDVVTTEIAEYYLKEGDAEIAVDFLRRCPHSNWSKYFHISAASNLVARGICNPFLKPDLESECYFTCSSLNKYGRFGHTMSEFHFLSTLADRLNVRLRTTDWIGDYIFSTNSFNVTFPPAPMLRLSADEINNLVSVDLGQILKKDLFSPGCFSRIDSSYVDSFREKFHLKPCVEKFIDEVTLPIIAEATHIIGVHIRLTDQSTRYAIPPLEWYIGELRSLIGRKNGYLVYLASDDIDSVKEKFLDFNFITHRDFSAKLNGLEWLLDFHCLTIADTLLLSQSGFSINASLLNKKCKTFYRPDFNLGRLISFDPRNFSLDDFLWNPRTSRA